jgi:ElaB/YqjD/DUF883 family membrane-anchored ribosome-binding protein
MKTEPSQFESSPSVLANGGVTNATMNVDRAPSGLEREVNSFFSDLEDLLTATTALTSEDLSKAKAKIGARITSAKASIERTGVAATDRARKAVKATDSYAHEQPWKSIGIGAVLGLLLGFVLAARRS